MPNGTPRSTVWWVVTWLLRFAVLAGGVLAWASFEAGSYRLALAYAGMAALAVGLQHVARRQALGWIIDGNGERQKVEGWVRGRAICTPTTHGQRLAEEATSRDDRRRALLWYGIPGWGAAALAYYILSLPARSGPGLGGFLLTGLVAFGFLIPWFCFLALEFLYLSGWQDMKGARVFDPEPARPGLDDVKQQKAHGAGRVADEDEALALLGAKPLMPNQAMKPSEIYLGYYSRQGQCGAPLPYGGERHLLLFGPNGSGKGTGLLVPNLLHLQNRSIVVIDPKGELAAITAKQRAKYGDVVILNPFGMLGLPSAGFNPLASLDPDAPTFFDDATGIGEALIRIEEKDPHWSESAQGLLVALVMWEVREARRQGRHPSLENVRTMLTEADESKPGPDGKSRLVKGLRITASQMVEEGGDQIASLIARFTRDTDEVASIRSTADRQTLWMLSQPMRDNLARNDIEFATLKTRPKTVYVVLPAERMRTHSVWLRLVIVTALRALYKPGGLRTLFILDEFAQLGRLGPIEDAFGLVRGYGVQLWPILQDLAQLQQLYEKRSESFVANAGIVMGFAPNDLTTADWMSRRASDTTAVAAGYNAGDNQSTHNQSQSHGMNYQQIKRPVFLPQEVMQLPAGTGLLFVAGSATSIPFMAPGYWEIDGLQNFASPNPYRPS